VTTEFATVQVKLLQLDVHVTT